MANKFLVWVDVGSDVMAQSDFASLSDRITGFKSGTKAVAANVNAGLRQANLVAAALMNAIAPNSIYDLNSSINDVMGEFKSHIYIDPYIINCSGAGGSAATRSEADYLKGFAAIGCGRNNIFPEQYGNSLLAGVGNNLYANNSIIYGEKNNASGNNLFVGGYQNDISGIMCAAIGHGNIMFQKTGQAIENVYDSVLFGLRNFCQYSTVFMCGSDNKAGRASQFVCGTFNKEDDKALLVVGYGDSENNRKNALLVDDAGLVRGDSLLSAADGSGTQYSAFKVQSLAITARCKGNAPVRYDDHIFTVSGSGTKTITLTSTNQTFSFTVNNVQRASGCTEAAKATRLGIDGDALDSARKTAANTFTFSVQPTDHYYCYLIYVGVKTSEKTTYYTSVQLFYASELAKGFISDGATGSIKISKDADNNVTISKGDYLNGDIISVKYKLIAKYELV